MGLRHAFLLLLASLVYLEVVVPAHALLAWAAHTFVTMLQLSRSMETGPDGRLDPEGEIEWRDFASYLAMSFFLVAMWVRSHPVEGLGWSGGWALIVALLLVGVGRGLPWAVHTRRQRDAALLLLISLAVGVSALGQTTPFLVFEWVAIGLLWAGSRFVPVSRRRTRRTRLILTSWEEAFRDAVLRSPASPEEASPATIRP